MASSFFSLKNWKPFLVYILRFFQPHEVVRLVRLNKAFYVGFYNDFFFEYSGELILGSPWNLCEPKRRSNLFKLFRQLCIVRIDPMVSSLCTADDMYFLLKGSSHTLERLYICSPCNSLLFGAVESQNYSTKMHCHSNSDTLNDVNSYEDSMLYPSDLLLNRVTSLLACTYYSSCSGFDLACEPIIFQSLIHLELSGNDGQMWGLFFMNCRLPRLETITLQTWTSDLIPLCLNQGNLLMDNVKQPVVSSQDNRHSHNPSFSRTQQRNGRKRSVSVSLDSNSRHDLDETFSNSHLRQITKNYHQTCQKPGTNCYQEWDKNYWARNLGCVKRGIHGLISLIDSVQESLREVELILAGDEGEKCLRFILSAEHFPGLSHCLSWKTMNMLNNFLKHPSYNNDVNDGCVKPMIVKNFLAFFNLDQSCSTTSQSEEKNKMSTRSVYEWISTQFEACVELIQHLLFRENEFKNLKTIRFLGLRGLTSGAAAVITAMLRQNTLVLPNQSSLGTEPVRNDHDIYSNNHLDLTCDSINASTKVLSASKLQYYATSPLYKTLVEHDNIAFLCEEEDKEVDVYPQLRCRLVFSGTWTLPRRCAFNLKLLYPLVIKRLVGSNLIVNDLKEQTVQRPYDQPRSFNDLNSLQSFSADDNRDKVPSHQYLFCVRLDTHVDTRPVREFQRLQQSLVDCSVQKYLWPRYSKSAYDTKKQNPNKRMSSIDICPAVSQNINDFFLRCASSINFLEVRFYREDKRFPQFAPMSFEALETLQLINWYEKLNPSHLLLFDLTYTFPPRHIHLIIDMRKQTRSSLYSVNPRRFFKDLREFLDILASRGLIVERLSLIPCPQEGKFPYLCYLFPVSQVKLSKAPEDQYATNGDMNNKNKLLSSASFELCLMITFWLNNGRSSSYYSVQKSHETDTSHRGQETTEQFTVKVNQHLVTLSDMHEHRFRTLREIGVNLCESQLKLKSKLTESNNFSEIPWSFDTISASSHKKNFLSKFHRLTPWTATKLGTHPYSIIAISRCVTQQKFRDSLEIVSQLIQILLTSRCCHVIEYGIAIQAYQLQDADFTENWIFWVFEKVFLPCLALFSINDEAVKGKVMCLVVVVQIDEKLLESLSRIPPNLVLQFRGPGLEYARLTEHSSDRQICKMVLNLYHPFQWSGALCLWVLNNFRSQLSKNCVMFLESKKNSLLCRASQSLPKMF